MNQKEKPLTDKQEAFCIKFSECNNASEAYRDVYSCGKMKPETINQTASKLYNNPKITTRVKELKNELKAKSDITKERIIEEYSKIAFSSIAHLHNTWIERKEFKTLTENQKACIKSIQTQTRKVVFGDEAIEIDYVKIELYDKLRALDSIVKMLGYDAPTKQEVTMYQQPIFKDD